MKRITVRRALAALVVLAALAVVTTTSKKTVPAAYASTGCSDATLNGKYAVIQPAGFTAPGNGTATPVPWQFVGVTDFKGDGTLSAEWTAAVNGAISGGPPNPLQTSSGNYTVNSDCAGSLTLTGPNAAGSTANLVVIGGGAEIFGIWTNTGNTATFDAKKQ